MTTATASRWALITGASAGIGAAFARDLAARGYSLVLTARRTDRLDTLAAELHERHGTHCRAIAFDLADPASAARLFAYTESEGIAVEMLVNNAGYGVPGALGSKPWDVHRDFLQVLLTVPVELSYRYLPGMQKRGRGYIVNIASLAGLVPGSAGHTLYGAAKAFLIKFSQSLALENRPRGVNAIAVCPGFTHSEFHDVTGARKLVSKMPSFMWMDADEVARDGIDAALRGEVVRVTGRLNRAIKAMFKLLPDGLALKLIQRRSRDFRDAA
jgi:hypothetical protein